MTELTGKVLGGRYRVEAFLGRGGMADVYKVRDMQRAAFLAMKVLHEDLAQDQAFLQHFVQEAQILEKLQHPNIVRFYGLEKADTLAFILMDFIDGLTLRREIFLFKNGLRSMRILEIMQPVCSALYYAHQMGMIHCDIKPANVITHRNGTVFLTDFGIARVTEPGSASLSSVGTPAYMAPELFKGKQPDKATDIYALGVVLFEILTGGQRPFSGETAQMDGTPDEKLIWEKQHLAATSPRMFNSEITPELEAVVMCCLQRSPQQRFRSALDLLRALEVAVRGAQPPDDEAQTRVDLVKKPGGTGRLSRARQALQTDGAAGLASAKDKHSAPARPAEAAKPPAAETHAGAKKPAEEAKPAAAEKPGAEKPAGAQKPAAAANQPPAGSEKPQPVVKKTPPEAQKSHTEKKAAPADERPEPAGGKQPVKKAAPAGEKPETAVGKPPAQKTAQDGGTSAARSAQPIKPAEAKKPAESKSQPEAPASGKPSSEPAKTPGRTITSQPAADSHTPKPSTRALPEGSKSHPPRKPSGLNPWLVAGAAALALMLIAMAIFSGQARAPNPTETPLVVSTSHRTAVSTTATTALPTEAAVNSTATAPIIRPQPVETVSAEPTPMGGSQKIAFASDRSGSLQIWIMHASSPESRQQVTEARDGACQPAWSPDGTRIAFTTPCKGPSVYYPGSTIKIVTLADKTITDLPVKSAGTAGVFDPAWAPDGETLAYTAILGEKTEIRSIGLKDLKVRVLVNRGTKNAQPAWSRDGKYIAFITSDDRDRDALWYMQSDGGSQELLARSAQFAEPAWTPDGLRILVSLNRGDNIPVLALVDRGNPTQDPALLLKDSYRMSRASVSPDGKWLVFWTDPSGSKPEIVLASLDGKQIQPLTNNKLRDFQPAWSPR